MSSLPNCQLVDEELSSYKKEIPNLAMSSFGSRLKSILEKHTVLQRFLLVLAVVGASMVIGDGVLTLALSGFSIIRFNYITFVFYLMRFLQLLMPVNSQFMSSCVRFSQILQDYLLRTKSASFR